MQKKLIILALARSIGFGLWINSDEGGEKAASIAFKAAYVSFQYTKVAALFDADAQYKLGEMYENADGVFVEANEANRAEAILLYTKAAEQGHSKSLIKLYELGNKIYELGKHYVNRDGVQINEAEVVKRLTQSAEQGHSESQFRLGNIYQNEVEAVRLWIKAAEQGHAESQFELGEIHGFPHSAAYNDAEALKWYTKAAEQGHAEALKWYTRAAEQSYLKAQVHLASMYSMGLGGLEKNDAEALKWYTKAAEQGHSESQYELGKKYEEGLGGLEKNDAEALKWYTKAAEQGHFLAKRRLKTALSEFP
jgi:TPR repeat protein